MNFKMSDVIEEVEDAEFLDNTCKFFKIENVNQLSRILKEKCLSIEEIETLADFHYISNKEVLLKLQHFFPDIFTLKYLRRLRKLKEFLRQENDDYK